MTDASVSVIIVSRGRPRALARCLRGIDALEAGGFEVVVVTDPEGMAAVAPWRDRIKAVPFDAPNIARARNRGIAAAAGDIVAFIDDDAVPEPTWLTRLVAPFAADEVMAAGGFVIGRNGISLQWGAGAVDRLGQRLPLDVDPEGVTVLRGDAGRGIRTEGTNMAFRRAALVGMGGFDERFAFYLDESDVNLRLGAAGAATAIVPLAQVHHGFAESARRRHDRVPRDLTEIGASLAVFLRKHGTDPAQRFAAELAEQRRRVMAHMVAGRLEPRDVRRLLDGFARGWAAGLDRAEMTPVPGGAAAGPFVPFRGSAGGPRVATVLAGRSWQGRALRAEAARRAARGETVSLFLLSPTSLFHRVAFDDGGYWVQTGGLFGPSLRSDPLFRYWRFRDRVSREVARVAPVRNSLSAP